MVNNGWLRVLGDKFYAYTRPDAIIVDEAEGKTMSQILGDITFKDLITQCKVLSERVDNMNKVLSQLIESKGLVSADVGMYAITESELTRLLELGAIDRSTLYLLVDEESKISVVTTTIKWLDPSGEVVDQKIYYGKIGALVSVDWNRDVKVGAKIYHYDVRTNPVIDVSTGESSLQVYGNNMIYTKNSVLTLTALS